MSLFDSGSGQTSSTCVGTVGSGKTMIFASRGGFQKATCASSHCCSGSVIICHLNRIGLLGTRLLYCLNNSGMRGTVSTVFTAHGHTKVKTCAKDAIRGIIRGRVLSRHNERLYFRLGH